MSRNVRKVSFNVNAYTARLIGRENVAKLEGAVLEIVKNAYDADAKIFCMYYSNTRNCIYCLDNGTGMTESVIRKHWMTIGNSSKKDKYETKMKRVQTGAKGIGRFALDRISDQCDMLTISSEGGLEWNVNWSDFDGKKNISAVKATISDTDQRLLEYAQTAQWENQEMARQLEALDFDRTGTVFVLNGLRDAWDETVFHHVKKNLETVLPPDISDGFRIFFFDDKTKVSDAEIKSSTIDSYDYRIDFQVKKEALAIRMKRNEFDFGGDEKEVYKEAGFDEEEQSYFKGKEKSLRFSFEELGETENLIGNYNGVLYFNKITSSTKDDKRFYYKDIKGRKNLTKEFGGIKLYRDHFRVRPYGEYGDSSFDWLGLAERSSRSPAGIGNKSQNWRVRSEQMVGIVHISRKNTNIEDAANRNGIQEGRGFSQLKKIILTVISEFERDRQSVGRKLAAYADYKDQLAAELERLRMLAEERKKWEEEQQKAETVKSEKKPENETEEAKANPLDCRDSKTAPTMNPAEAQKIIEALQEKQEEEIQDLQDENKLLQALATTGIITNMFMHEIRTLTNNIGQELDAAYEAIKYDQDMDEAFQNIKRAITFKKNFASWFAVTIESIKKDKRLRKKQDIELLLRPFLKTWKEILARNNVKLRYECEPGIEFKCFAFDVENIISNLISNSLAAFDREGKGVLEKKEILITIQKEEEGFILSYEDTGWGLVSRYKARPELILEAFETERGRGAEEEDGTGMGMWIIYKTILEYNGGIDLSRNKENERGFFVKLSLGGNYV